MGDPLHRTFRYPDEETKAKIEAIAERQNRTVNFVIREALKNFVSGGTAKPAVPENLDKKIAKHNTEVKILLFKTIQRMKNGDLAGAAAFMAQNLKGFIMEA